MFQDRIYLLFFLFFSLIFIFSIQITRISLNNVKIFKHESSDQNFFTLRRDIVDRNGILISRNISSFHVAINPKLVNNKKNLLIKLRLAFPELDIEILKKLSKEKYFYLKKRVSQADKEKLWRLEKKELFLNHFNPEFTHMQIYTVI